MRRTGVHFELTEHQRRELWDAYERQDDAAVLAVVQALESQWDEKHLQETDKAWDAIHRCLGDAWPLSGTVLGGECVYFDDDCIIRFLDVEDVKEVAGALKGVTRDWFTARFAKLRDQGYEGSGDERDLQYTWRWFEALRSFFQRASANGRSVAFSAQ